MYLSSNLNCIIKTDRINRYDISYMLYKNDNELFKNKKIFKNTKNTNNFITKAIETDVSLLISKKDEIECEDDKTKAFLENLLLKNGWEQLKYKVARSFLIFGDAFIKIEEDDIKGIRLKEISPYFVENIVKDNSIITYVKLRYKDVDGNIVEEEYTDTTIKITTEKEGKASVKELENKLGLVPFVHFYAKDNLEEDSFGRNYMEEIVDLIVNNAELSSICLTIFKMYADPTYVLKADSNTILQFLKLNGNKMQIDLTKGKGLIAIPKTKDLETDFEIMKGAGVPADFIAFIEHLEQNIKDNLPELSLDSIQQNANASALALEVQTYNLKSKIEEIRTRYNTSVNLMLDIVIKIAQLKKMLSSVEVAVSIKTNGFFNFREEEEKKERDKKFEKILKLLDLELLTKEQVQQIIKEEKLL